MHRRIEKPCNSPVRPALERLEDRTAPAVGRLLGAPSAAWLDGVYNRFLGRTVDGSGEQFWLGRVAAGATPRQVVASVLGSDEFAARASDDWVASVYDHLLGRAPDASGHAYWRMTLNQGQSPAAVAESVLGSSEFQTLDAPTRPAKFHPLYTPNDPNYLNNNLYGLNGTLGIKAPTAWDATVGKTNVTVAVIDTGTDYDHPDLYLNIWLNQTEIPATRRANLTDTDTDGLITFWDLNSAINQGPGKIVDENGDGRISGSDVLAPMNVDAFGNDLGTGGWADHVDGNPANPLTENGYTDDLVGWNFFDDLDPTKWNKPQDDNSHGTHVAGTIGAIGNNLTGVVGVNWKTQIMVLRFIGLGPGGFEGSDDDAAAAIRYAAANGARVSNNSYGGNEESPLIDEAVNEVAALGHLYVVAAGNSGGAPTWPARSHLPNMVTVANTTSSGALASSSSFDSRLVDVAAPGSSILSTTPNGGYGYKTGTSMATPHVAGVAALGLSLHPEWTVTQLKDQIVRTTTPVSGLVGKTISGIVNATRALTTIVPGPSLAQVADFDGDGVKDLYVLKQSATNSSTTEIDVLDGASHFQNLLFHTATALHPIDNTFALQLGDYNGDGKTDLLMLKKSNTGSHTTEAHVMNGADGFQTFLLHTATPLHETDQTFDFQFGDYNRDGKLDIMMFKKSLTGSNSTEVHALNGATFYQTFLLHAATGLHETGSEASFLLIDLDNDNLLDLVYFKRQNTGTGTTEVHALGGASGFQTFILHSGSFLPLSGAETDFSLADYNGDGKLDLFAIKKYGGASGKIEIDIASGATSYSTSLGHIVTGLGQTAP